MTELQECRIAERLVRHGIMKRVTCFEQNSFVLFHSYKVRLLLWVQMAF